MASYTFAQSGQIPAGHHTLSQFASSLVFITEAARKRTTNEKTYQALLVDNLQFHNQRRSRIDTSEEVSKLGDYQQSYLAVTRAISVTRTLHDVLNDYLTSSDISTEDRQIPSDHHIVRQASLPGYAALGKRASKTLRG